jgi:hypothetical protein
MLQKQVITMLVALSVPMAGLLASSLNGSGSSAAWAADNKTIAQADGTSGAGSSGAGQSDMGKSDGSNAGNGSNQSGGSSGPGGTGTTNAPGDTSSGATTSPGGTGANGTGDASLDSIWSETPTPAGKNKARKKSRGKSKTTRPNDSTGASGLQPSDLSPSQPASTGANATADTAPVSTAPASPATTTPIAPATTTTAATSAATSSTTPATPVSVSSPAPAGSANSSSDFGYTDANSPATPAATPATNANAAAPTYPATKSDQVNTAPTTSTNTTVSTPASTKGSSDNYAGTTNSPNYTNITSATRKADDAAKPAPLCATHSFFQSDLIRTVCWPGVGPFKGDTDPNDLADPQENKLTLQSTKDKLTSAELFLMHQPGNSQGFINLQMVMDFMLEALGAKDKKISDFNAYLDKNKAKMVKKKATDPNALTTTTGPYLISIEQGTGANSNESSYLISVKIKDATTDFFTRHGVDVVVNPSEDTIKVSKGSGTNTTAIIATNTPPVKRPPDSAATKPAKQAPPREVKEVKEVKAETGQTSGDSLKQEFVDTIRGWQTIKKAAVRNQDPSELSKVLSGKALDKQTVAIGWLVKKKDYYDLNPKGVTVDRYEEISQSPKRYAVYAQVKEVSKLMDQTTGKQLSESDDQYNVKYTIERSGDHWTIYDSDLVKPGGGTTADQSKGKSKPKH